MRRLHDKQQRHSPQRLRRQSCFAVDSTPPCTSIGRLLYLHENSSECRSALQRVDGSAFACSYSYTATATALVLGKELRLQLLSPLCLSLALVLRGTQYSSACYFDDLHWTCASRRYTQLTACQPLLRLCWWSFSASVASQSRPTASDLLYRQARLSHRQSSLSALSDIQRSAILCSSRHGYILVECRRCALSSREEDWRRLVRCDLRGDKSTQQPTSRHQIRTLTDTCELLITIGWRVTGAQKERRSTAARRI